ncbi:peptide ABC transporter permease [Chromobacterium violaceum]|uniref:ABC transporter permease n=1 Tax=Chromobacterium violaceum TaxID=536 RepID=UPI000653CCDF|nr:ABC transporter permease [Chromobacterium violaceum]KMN51651.1 peptide ABC transporter permease [Chromobacterium violaceum]KMN84642.1 peptide ABC transporter permease [Chromobacterium violaceum]KMN88599.1 peptide ABC transporter permease [Chromobacterium violaceum]KMO05926.1 peptide ABC transporter permease [Chromobacterium violaceum]
MFAFIIRRLWQMIPTMLGVMLLVFVLFNWVGGDPTFILEGKRLTPEMLANIRVQLGLDKSLPEQFLLFVKQVLTYDFGNSWATQQSVSGTLANRVGPSLTLAGSLLVLELLTALPIAVAVAYFRGTLTDRLVTMICTVAMSVSSLVYIIVGQYQLAFVMDLFPVMGWDDNSLAANLLVYLPLPLILGILVALAPSVRFYRSFVVEELNHDYVRTARAKGLPESRVLFKHVLRNALIPVVTNITMSLPFLMLGSMLLERFFGIPGMGNELLNAVDKSDFPVIKAITITIAAAAMVFNLLADVLYKWIDPRVQLK